MLHAKPTEAGILRHHKNLAGDLQCRRIKSACLGIYKPYYVYTPPGFSEVETLPLVYLFRGHEREWVNINEDGSRGRSTAIQDIDLLIQREILPPVLLIMPGVSSTNNAVHSLGINMTGDGVGERGIGSGEFWTYLTTEFFPMIDRRYANIKSGNRIGIGFSLGGFICSLLATRFPGYFDHVGIYDGTLPFPDFVDPRLNGASRCSDRVWCQSKILEPALGKPRRVTEILQWNPTNLIQDSDFHSLHRIRKTTFWVASAALGGYVGNRDRSRAFQEELEDHDIPVGTGDVIFSKNAAHTWHWTDRFAVSLLFHLLVDDGRPVSGSLGSTTEHFFEESSASR